MGKNFPLALALCGFLLLLLFTVENVFNNFAHWSVFEITTQYEKEIDVPQITGLGAIKNK